MLRFCALLTLLISGSALRGADIYSTYDLLAPSTHAFDIIDDISTDREGAAYLFSPIRKSSTSSKERAIDQFTGKPLDLDKVDAAAARASGLVPGRIPDDQKFIRVKFAQSVPKNGEERTRIYKTFTDPASYNEKDDTLIFERQTTVKRSIVILPTGYELIRSEAPAIVSTDADGRIRISFLNDRDDQLLLKIIGRRRK